MDITYENDKTIIKATKCTNIDLIFNCGQAFRFDKNDSGEWCGVAYGKYLRIRQNEDTIEMNGANQSDFESLWFDYFDFGRDYDTLLTTFESDELLKKSRDENYGIRILKQEPWETLCSFIISQNNNIPRIKGIIKRLCENFGEKAEDDYTFPTAERLAGLSCEDLAPIRAGFRNQYILDAARKTASKTVDLEKLFSLSTDEAQQELLNIKGVGCKVAQCVLLFAYGRTDAFPIDVWVKRVMTLYPNGLPAQIEPFKGIAQQYLFQYIRKHPEIAEKI